MHPIEFFYDDTYKEIEYENIADYNICDEEQKHDFVVLSFWLEIMTSAVDSISHDSNPSLVCHEHE